MINSYYLCITQPTNVGDLLINKMLVEELCKYGKVYVDAHKTPSDFKNILLENPNAYDAYAEGMVTIKGPSIIKLYRFFKKNNIKVYTSSPGPLGKGLFIYNLVLGFAEQIAHAAGVRIYRIGACCSQMISKGEILKKGNIDQLLLRSKESVDYAQKTYECCRYIPDLAFLYRKVGISYSKQEKVAVTFRSCDSHPDFLEWCRRLVLRFLEKGFTVCLYYQVEGDREFMNLLYASLKDYTTVEYEDKKLWWENLSFYEDKKYIVSNRLHALLLGAVHDAIPVICTNNDNSVTKIKHVFNSSFTGLKENLYLEYGNDVCMDALINNYAEYRDYIVAGVNRNYNSCVEIIKSLIDETK